jgi:hypothetical protein
MQLAVAKKTLQPLRELSHDSERSQDRQQGLAAFCAPGVFILYRVAIPFASTVVIDERFHVKRLLPAIHANPQFYVLALSRNQVRLLKASPHGFQTIHPLHMPASIEESLNLQPADRGEQVHSAMRGDLGKEAAVFHGQGGHRDTLKEEIAEYFRLIDKSLFTVLRGRSCPLILAGVDYETTIFRDISSYKHIAKESLVGSFDFVSDRTLYEKALPLAKRDCEKMKRRALEKSRQLSQSDLAAYELEKIVPAAHRGQIDVLLVNPQAAEYGRFHPETNWVEFTRQQDPSLELLETATAQTILHRGTVYAVAPGELPSGHTLGAIFRF